MTANGDDMALEAAATLAAIDQARRRTRAAVHQAWFPMTLFGIFGLASAPLCAVGHGLGQGLFWLVAAPTGGVMTARFYHRRALATGAGVRGGPYWAVGAGIFVAAWIAGATESPSVETAGPMVAVALGYLVFAWLERSWPVAVCSAILATFAVGVGIAGIHGGCVVLSLTFGALFTVTGVVLRRRERG
jgi:hypothetical protein